MSELSLVPPPDPRFEVKQADIAWRHVLRGYDAALTSLPPQHPERPFLLELRGYDALAARQPAATLTPVGGSA